MSGEPKTLTLTERESYLISRVGDAWVELNRKHYDFARDELAEAQIAADDVTEAAARARDEAAELRAVVRDYLDALDSVPAPTSEPWNFGEREAAHTRIDQAEAVLRRLAGGESEK